MTTMTVPNLDKMTVNELREFAYMAMTLVKYANTRVQLIEDIHAGRTKHAVQKERECLALFHKLPAEWRWEKRGVSL